VFVFLCPFFLKNGFAHLDEFKRIERTIKIENRVQEHHLPANSAALFLDATTNADIHRLRRIEIRGIWG